MFLRLYEASSAISSSEMIHFSISLFKLVRGSIASNNSSRLSFVSASSRLEKVLILLATFSRELIRSSSPMPRVLPISKRFKDSPISCNPENDTLPFCQIRVRASLVCCCMCLISCKSVEGVSSSHKFFPRSDAASSFNCSIIL